MPVGEAVAIVYLSPFAVMMLAIPLLGEKVSRAGWIGAAIGFLGVLRKVIGHLWATIAFEDRIGNVRRHDNL